MKKAPTVSILLNSYNGEKFIAQQIQSIISQTFTDYELLVYDDCSKDSTISIVKKIVGNDPRVKIFKNPKNLGLIESFKNGLTMLTGKYICLADNDNFWLSTRLQREVDYLNLHTDVDMIFHDSFVSDQNLAVNICSFTRSLKGNFLSIASFDVHNLSLENLIDYNQVTGISLMFRKELIPKVRQIPEGDMHDNWIAKLTAADSQIGYIDEPLIIYRQHQNNMVGTEVNSNKFYLKSIFEPKWSTFYIDKAKQKINSLKILKKLTSTKNRNHYFIDRKIKYYQHMVNICNSNIFSLFPRLIVATIFSIRENYRNSYKYYTFFFFNRLYSFLTNPFQISSKNF